MHSSGGLERHHLMRCWQMMEAIVVRARRTDDLNTQAVGTCNRQPQAALVLLGQRDSEQSVNAVGEREAAGRNKLKWWTLVGVLRSRLGMPRPCITARHPPNWASRPVDWGNGIDLSG